MISTLTDLSLTSYQCKISTANTLKVLSESDLLKKTSLSPKFDPDHVIKDLVIQTDSRQCSQDTIFIAITGSTSDGHLFIEDAFKKGVLVFIGESFPETFTSNPEIICFEVKSSRQAWSCLCAASFKNPQDSLNIIGVTGTNGKTSTVWMIRNLLDSHDSPCLCIGTLGAFFPDSYVATSHTTPDPNQLFWLFALAIKKGIKHVVMEVSSHSLVQKKVACIKFTIGIFTSFSRDHLDFHKTMDVYFASKCTLFSEHLDIDGTMIISQDISDQNNLLPTDKKSIFYGNKKNFCESVPLKSAASFNCYLATDSLSIKGCRLSIALTSCDSHRNFQKNLISSTPFFAPHAIENLCASILAFFALKGRFPNNSVIKKMTSPPGRLEPVSIEKSEKSRGTLPFLLVDYAHTPDALLKTIQIIKKINLGPLVLVFGCGGDRDPGKRPLMGAIASEHCHKTFITSDNPRTEEPADIINQIRDGVPAHQAAHVVYEIDRKIAIFKALEYCLSLDSPCTLLIAGKGHETYQIIGNVKTHFDDRIVALEALKRLL